MPQTTIGVTKATLKNLKKLPLKGLHGEDLTPPQKLERLIELYELGIRRKIREKTSKNQLICVTRGR